MLRVILDVNVLVSALLRQGTPPSRVLDAWRLGAFELVVSDASLDELASVVTRPHIARNVAPDTATDLMVAIRQNAILASDPPPGRHVPRDPDDDYLVALALRAGAHAIVTGDSALLAVRLEVPRILTPRDFLAALEGA